MRSGPVLSPDVLREGYRMAVDQSLSLLRAGMELQQKEPPVALGLAELGQEEVGKSLSILAAMWLPADRGHWAWFWSSWKNHVRKAHRAFLYELIDPTRIELRGPDGQRHAGLSARGSIAEEKEAGLYVNFDHATNRFRHPGEAVASVEVFNRTAALLYLAIKADRVRAALEATADLDSYRKFSEVAFRICSEPLYQEDMPALLSEFGGRSADHKDILDMIQASLVGGNNTLEQILARSRRATDTDAAS